MEQFLFANNGLNDNGDDLPHANQVMLLYDDHTYDDENIDDYL